MSKRSLQLLLVENVEHLGIVGDIVDVKPGYARNYLLPHGLAEWPSEDRLAELQERRSQVQKQVSALRHAREELHGRMEEVTVKMIRSCNDQGLLYGSVTQSDIADALQEAGYDVGSQSIRLGQTIKRVGEYPVPVQFDKDLRCEINLVVDPDHPIGEEREEMEFDDEGNLIPPRRRKKTSPPAADPGPAVAENTPTPESEASPVKEEPAATG